MGYGHRSVHVGGPRGVPLTPRLDTGTQEASSFYGVDVPPCPSPSIHLQQELCIPQSPLAAKWPGSAVDNEDVVHVSVFFSEAFRLLRFLPKQIDGAAIRRMIVSNLSSKQESKNLEFDDLL